MKSFGSYVIPIIVAALYLFLYIPIFVLIVFSFNSNAFTCAWSSFTTHWYADLFASVEIWDALKNSLIIAVSSVCLSLMIGSSLIFFGSRERVKSLLPFFYGSLAMPEIILAAGLLSFFSFFAVPLGAMALIAGHTLLGLAYVIPILYDRLSELDNSLIEASYDLGATQRQTFFSIVLPLLMPALMASGLLVFIISLDDFLISFFCAGASMQTLPLYIFAVIRTGASPIINALSTIMLIISSVCVLFVSFVHIKKLRMPE
ncbi:MAG TPA: ABC transporter permease [Candidatus Babeliales bacterium]|jgi:spermidine/putrescine transport system permease protein|nr:ABC transporter permease [Candidatus Babeliales bacterium]